MKTIKWFLIGVVVAGLGLGWFAYTRHIIRDEDGLRIVPKTENSLQHIFVDTRDWGPMDWLNNKAVRDAIAKDEYERMRQAATDAAKGIQQKFDQTVDDLQKQVDEGLKKK